jgi:hypothetical protein
MSAIQSSKLASGGSESGGTNTPSTPAEASEAVLLEWTVHLLRREPGRVVVVISATLFTALVGFLLFHSLLFTLAGVFMIFSSTIEYLFPIRYKLTESRAFASYGASRFEIPWSGVHRLLDAPTAVKLSPLKQASRLDAYRGVLLRFAEEGEPGNREEVLRIIEGRIAASKQEAASEA